jgi:death-on-curing protein
MTDYLTLAEVLTMHKILIDRYGGSQGLRDAGALEAALYRPQTGYYQDVIQEAAALWESLNQNHPFIDGNKRVAFAATHTFLKLNGIRLTATASDTETFILSLFEKQAFEYANLEHWLRQHTESTSPIER